MTRSIQGLSAARAWTPKRYRYAGQILASELPLPELVAARAPSEAPMYAITCDPGAMQAGELAWLHHWVDGEDACELSLARVAEGYLLRFPDLADIVVSSSGKIRVSGLPGVAARTLRHLLLDQVLPRLLAQRGKLVLHASAVGISDRSVVLILGLSGHGKSTLAAGLAAQRGSRVLADDCVIAGFDGDRLLAVPSYSGLRLWPDSLAALFPQSARAQRVNDYSDKMRMPVARSANQSGWPVAAILVLDRAEPDDARVDTQVTPIDASRACMALMSNAFQLDVGDAQHVYRLLGIAADAAQRAPVLSLRHRRDFSKLPQVARAILDHPAIARAQ